MNLLSKRFLVGFGVRAGMVLVLLAAFQPSRLLAQGYGSIVGTVTDATGAAVAGATVTATQTDTGRLTVVTSSQTGAFVFPTLPPAPYSLTVAATGFEKFDQTGLVLQADQSVTVNAKLAVGAATETVEVSSAVPQIDTTTGTLSQVIDQERVVDLPLNGRNAASLVTLVAGVVVAPGNGLDQGTTKTFPAAVSITANGSQASQSNFLLNGGNNVDELTNVNAPFPFPDAIQEFSVQTSNYNAEYGQSAGAVVNIVTKSGGRKFHGTAFEFLRNGYFNAKPYFASTADHLHRHQFGGTIGGPVIIPHLSTGTKTQFFFGYQHTLVHNLSSSSSATVPTLAEEGLTPGGPTYGDFGSLCTGTFTAAGTAGNPGNNYCSVAAQQLFNPFTGKEYALNQIPASDFDPAAVALEKHVPTYAGTPAAGKVGGLVFYNKPTTQTYNEYFARVDHTLSSRDHLFGHYYMNDFAQAGILDSNNLLTYASFSNVRYHSALLSETHTFSNSLLNSLVVNYQREISLRGGPPGSPDITDFGVTNIFQPTENKTIQSVSVSGYFSVSASAYALWQRNNYTFNDDVHWVKGNHSFAFGGHIEISKFDLTNTGSTNGTFGFGNFGTNFNALANYQMGYMTAFQQGIAEFIQDRNHFPGAYAQDSWKANRHLSLNYGVRWEIFEPWADKLGGQTEFSTANYAANVHSSVFTSLPAGMLVSGDKGVVQNGVRNQYAQFMPRVGFAYDVRGDGKTVVRGGGGIFYQDRVSGFLNLSQSANAPYTVTATTTDANGTAAFPGGPFSNPYCTGCATGQVVNPFPYTLPFPANKTFPTPIYLDEYAPNGQFRVPVTDDFNLTVEQEIVHNVAMRLAYVGSVSRHQYVDLELNPAVNNGANLSTDQRRVYNTAPVVGPCTTTVGCAASFKQIVEADMSASTSFHSLQATLELRRTHGISLLFNYTYSHALDNLPYALGTSNTEDLNAGESYVYPLYPAGIVSNTPANYKGLDYGPSDFDHPNVLSASYVYVIPKMSQGFLPLRAVVNGWRLSGLIQHHSGDALTVTAGSDVSLTGLNQDRGQRAGTTSIYTSQSAAGTCSASTAHCVNWLTPGALVKPTIAATGGFGNVVKGSIRGPAYTNWDAAVIRSFPIYRETNLDFRVEYFDLLNHTILNDPATSLSSATYGQVTGENGAGPRIAQFSLKYVF
jgi:hypothetical protein